MLYAEQRDRGGTAASAASTRESVGMVRLEEIANGDAGCCLWPKVAESGAGVTRVAGQYAALDPVFAAIGG